MAEEVVKSNEFGGFTQKNDVEDPIIVVQRFLNIFRQLHIFNERKREEFDQMLLKLPDDVRGKFASIPGGSLLQEYAQGVEAKHGVLRGVSVADTTSEYAEEIIKAKIFAQALAEAQAKFMPPAPQVVQSAPMTVMPNSEAAKLQERIAANNKAIIEARKTDDGDKINALQKENAVLNDRLKNVAANNGNPFMGQGLSGDLKVVADKAFAKEIATAFAQAMLAVERPQKSDDGVNETEMLTKIAEIGEERNKRSMEVIARTISDSQIKLAQMMIEHNTAMAIKNISMPESFSPAAPVAPVAAQMPNLQDIIGGVIKAQTDQLSSMITGALKESHKLSSQSIVDALSSFQKDNSKMMEIQHKNAVLKAKTKAVKAPAAEPVREPIPAAVTTSEPIKHLSSGQVVKTDIKEEIAKAGLNNVLFDIDDLETPNRGVSNPHNIGTMPELNNDFVIEKSEEPAKSNIVFEPNKVHHEDFSMPKELKPKETPLPDNNKEEVWEWQVPNNMATAMEEKELETRPGIVDKAEESNTNDEMLIFREDEPEAEVGESDDEGWEWEEVEVDENGNEVADEEGTANGDAEGEWEWEYEEVEEEPK